MVPCPVAAPTARVLYAVVRSTFKVDTAGMVHLRAERLDDDLVASITAPTHEVRPARPFDVRMSASLGPSSFVGAEGSVKLAHTSVRSG